MADEPGKVLEEKDLHYLDDRQSVTVGAELLPIVDDYFTFVPPPPPTAKESKKKDGTEPEGVDPNEPVLKETDIRNSTVAPDSLVSMLNETVTLFSGMSLKCIQLLTFCLSHYRFQDRKGKAKSQDAQQNQKGDAKGSDGQESQKEEADGQAAMPTPVPASFRAHVRQLLEIFPGMNEKDVYREVDATIKAINDHPFTFVATLPSGKKAKVSLFWFSSFMYVFGTGDFVFRLTPEIYAFSCSRVGRFTMDLLKNFARCESVLAARLFFNLKARLNYAGGVWRVTVEDFKEYMGVQGKYTRWCDLKRSVLDPAVKEVNGKSSLLTDYTTGKWGRRINEIIFRTRLKAAEDPSVVSTIGDVDRDYMLLREQGLTKAQATQMAAAAKEQGRDMERILQRLTGQYERKPKDDRPPKAAYVVAALRGELGPNLFDKIAPDAPPVVLKADLKAAPGQNGGAHAPQLPPPDAQDAMATLNPLKPLPPEPQEAGEAGKLSALIGSLTN